MKETDLHQPVAAYLEEQGYRIDAEVKDIDMVARRDEELVALEFKTAFNATLLRQAVWHQREVESVYLVLPHPGRALFGRPWKKTEHLIKRLALGLILVSFDDEGRGLAQVVFHPEETPPRLQPKGRRAIIREVEGRSINYNKAGSSRVKLMTAYRENCLKVAFILAERESASPKEIAGLGGGTKTASILQRNLYGWFERVSRGLYRLHPAGHQALAAYPELAEALRVKGGKPIDEPGAGFSDI